MSEISARRLSKGCQRVLNKELKSYYDGAGFTEYSASNDVHSYQKNGTIKFEESYFSSVDFSSEIAGQQIGKGIVKEHHNCIIGHLLEASVRLEGGVRGLISLIGAGNRGYTTFVHSAIYYTMMVKFGLSKSSSIFVCHDELFYRAGGQVYRNLFVKGGRFGANIPNVRFSTEENQIAYEWEGYISYTELDSFDLVCLEVSEDELV